MTINLGEEYTKLGSNIKKRRGKLGITITALANKSKVGKKTISEIENGVRNPRIYTLYKISRGLNFSLFKLFEGIS